MKLPPAVSSYLFMPTVHFQERQNMQIVDVAGLAANPLCCGQDSECEGVVPNVDTCAAGACL